MRSSGRVVDGYTYRASALDHMLSCWATRRGGIDEFEATRTCLEFGFPNNHKLIQSLDDKKISAAADKAIGAPHGSARARRGGGAWFIEKCARCGISDDRRSNWTMIGIQNDKCLLQCIKNLA